MPTSLAVVADREKLNLESIISHIKADPDSFTLNGVIVPFNEMDEHIIQLIDRLPGMRKGGLAMPIEGGESERDLVFIGDHGETNFVHAPYQKGMNEEQRREYGLKLLRILDPIQPDVIFLSNYKAILAREFVDAYEGRIVNVHPSVLPYNRGWRTEKMALDQGNQDASGYTFHVVVPNVDEGAVLFQQKVPIEGHDEESLRLATMRAQALYTPRVLEWYARALRGEIETRIVNAAEAFAIEGRDLDPSEHTEYHLMLFRHEGEFKPLEQILDVPEYAPVDEVEGQFEYRFELQGSKNGTYRRFGLFTAAAPTLESRAIFQQSEILVPGRDIDYGTLVCVVRTSSTEFGDLLDQQRIHYRLKQNPVAANAPRRDPFGQGSEIILS